MYNTKPWKFSNNIAQPAAVKIRYKTDDDVSVHQAFETHVKNAVNSAQPSMSRLRHGVSVVGYDPKTFDDSDTLPELTLKQLLRLRQHTEHAHLDVQVGIRGKQLLFSARKRIEPLQPDETPKTKKRGREDDEKSVQESTQTMDTSKRQRMDESGNTNGQIDKPAPFTVQDKGRMIAKEFGLLREAGTNSKVVDTVVINVNDTSPSERVASTPPKIILVVKLISGTALALNDLHNICSRHNIEDGLLTSRNIRQSSIADIGTPTWRAAKTQGLIGATLLLNVV